MRFFGFTQDWERKKLGDIGETYSGLSGKTKEDFGTGKPYIQYKQVFDNSKIDISRFDYVQINETENQNRVKYGDILFTTSSETPEEIGMSSVLLDEIDELYLNSFCFGYRLSSIKTVNPAFAQFLFRNNHFRNIVKILAQGSTRYNLSKNQLMKSEISFPSIEEQRKISDFLSLIDEKILSQSKIIRELETLINTVNEMLFSQELRFTEFISEPQLMVLSEVLIKNSVKNKTQKYQTVQSISNKYGFINQEEIFEDRRVASLDISNYYIVKKGYFAYNPSRINVGSLAYKKDDEISVISPLYISFKVNNNILDDHFIWYWFKSTKFIRQMYSSFEGSVRNTLSYESLIKMNISIPSLEEQKRIFTLLLCIDHKIETEKKLLKKYQFQKQYLLQNLFI